MDTPVPENPLQTDLKYWMLTPPGKPKRTLHQHMLRTANYTWGGMTCVISCIRELVSGQPTILFETLGPHMTRVPVGPI